MRRLTIMMRTVRTKAGIAALLLPALLSACSESRAVAGELDEASVPEEQRYGGIAVVAENTDFEDLNPLTATHAQAANVIRDILFMPLLRWNEQLELAPNLARSWEVNADSTVLTFRLRHDIRWHDGTPVTAYDLKFTYDLGRDPGNPLADPILRNHFGDAEAVDSFTFRVQLRPSRITSRLGPASFPFPATG
jgi:peptide/nickel transport system substrate-binding protein